MDELSVQIAIFIGFLVILFFSSVGFLFCFIYFCRFLEKCIYERILYKNTSAGN